MLNPEILHFENCTKYYQKIGKLNIKTIKLLIIFVHKMLLVSAFKLIFCLIKYLQLFFLQINYINII